MATIEELQQQLADTQAALDAANGAVADTVAERDALAQALQAVTAERDAARVWQGRASQLVNLVDPERSFGPGAFESLDDAAWAALVVELRGKALTNEKVILARQAEAQKAADRQAALAKLTAKEREALGV